MIRPFLTGGLCALLATYAAAQTTPPIAATGTVQYAFAPNQHADSMIIAAIDEARTQVLVQAYSFTHRRIADALLRAHRRGVEIAVIVDAEQAQGETGVLRELTRGGVMLRYDSHHAAAHNKIMLIDTADDHCAVVTGSFNFTYAAQQRNAENALILRGNPSLCAAYYDNWRRHYTHASARR